jgi:hypothetical protein
VASIDEIRKSDPRLSELAAVSEQWEVVIGHDKVTVADVIRRATERRSGFSEEGTGEFIYPEFREALLAIAGVGGGISSRRLGKWLAESCGRVVNRQRFSEFGKRQGVALWFLENIQ